MAHRSHDPGVRDRQKGDASSESTDTSFLRFGRERRSKGVPFLVSRRSLRSCRSVAFLAFGRGAWQRQHGGVSWSPTPHKPHGSTWTKGARGLSCGLEGISTVLVRTALTRLYPREQGKGIAVPVSWRVFVRRVEPVLMLSLQSFESFMMPHHPTADLSKRRSGCKWRIAGFFAGISSDQTP